MVRLTFNQSKSELMVRAAATILFRTLERQGAKEVSIAELAQHPQYGFTASAALAPVGPKLVRITDLQDGKIVWGSVPYCECAEPEKYLLRENDILFARTGATTGKTHLVHSPEAAVFASYLIRLRPKPEIDPGYLYAFFQSDNYWSQISEEKEGSAQPNVNGDKLSSLKIPRVRLELQHAIAEFVRCVRRRQDGDSIELPKLPEPLVEQRRIVGRIEKFAGKIEKARGLRKQAEEETVALSASARRSLFGETPGANWVPLKQFVAEIENGKSPQCESRPASEDEWGVLKVGAVSFGSFDEAENKALPVGFAFDPRYEVRPGDFLMSRANTTQLVGTCAIVAQTRQRLLLSDKTFRFRFHRHAEILPQWLAYAMKSSVLRDQIERGASGTSPTMKNISKEKVLRLLFPPHALPEQRRIVAYLDNLQQRVDTLKTLQTEGNAELDALMPSILDKAFRGEFLPATEELARATEA